MSVGMYGIPFVFARAGFFLGLLELVILTGVILLIHLLYGEIVLRTRAWHRLPGYAEVYLGKFARRVEIFSYTISISGALSAYVLLGGAFISNIFPAGASLWPYLLLGVGAFILFWGVQLNAKVDMALITIVAFLIVLLFFLSLPFINPENLTSIDMSQWFLPYGILMFALAGMAAVPDMVGILESNPRKLRQAIIVGTIIPAILYALFAFAVVGVSGWETSEEAIFGLAMALGGPVLFLGSIIGMLTTFTSFITLGSVFKSMLHLDVGIPWRAAWFLTILPPLFFLFLGYTSYLPLIGFIGGIFIALDGIITLFIYRRAVLHGDRRSEYSLHIPGLVLAILGVLFITGLLHQLFI